MTIGGWYEQSGSFALALQAYQRAIEKGGNAVTAARASTQVAHLHNRAHQRALAVATLEPLVEVITTLADDLVQFVVTEYCQALRDLGRVNDARVFVRGVIRSFPTRAELPLLEQELLGAPE
jgi:hypothetical protein